MKDAYWFKHDCNAQYDEKIEKLVYKHGWAGYGIFWALIERLRDSSEYKLGLDSIPIIAHKMNIDVIVIESILKDFDLFKFDKKFFWSQSLLDRLRKKDEKRQKLSEAGKKGNQIRWAITKGLSESPPDRHPIANTSQEEEKRKEENNIYRGFINSFNAITKKSFKGTAKDKKQFLARIKEGYTIEKIETAIKTCLNDKYHKENPQYLTPEFITRADKLEKYLNSGSANEPEYAIIFSAHTASQRKVYNKEDYLRIKRNGSGISDILVPESWKAS